MLMRLSHRSIALAAGVSLCLAAGSVSAQDVVTAKALFDRGLADMEAGQYETGCKAVAESQRLDPRAGTLFTLAVCEERRGRVASAVTRYEEYLRLFDKLPPDQQARQGDRPRVAREQRDKLGPDVPRLTVSLPAGAPAGLVVTRDGLAMSDVMLGVALPIDPGEHVISTQAPGGPEKEQRVSLAKGENKTVVVTFTPEEPKTGAGAEARPAAQSRATVTLPGTAATPLVPPSPAEQRRRTGYLVFGAGLVGIAAGAVLGGVAIGKQIESDHHCGAAIGSSDPNACDTTGLAAGQMALPLGAGSVAAFVLGGAAVVTGAVIFRSAPRGADPTNGSSIPTLAPSFLAAPGALWLGASGMF